MPTPDDIKIAKETLYQTSGVRDDLNDDEATVLLEWAEKRIDQLAQKIDADFDQQNRFLRQLLARIDRFVGQRAFLNDESHAEHLDNLMKALGIADFGHITLEQIVAGLPSDKANMAANLQAILHTLTPPVTVDPTPPTVNSVFTEGLDSTDENPSAYLTESDAIWSTETTSKTIAPKKDDETDPTNPLKGFIRRLKNLGDMGE